MQYNRLRYGKGVSLDKGFWIKNATKGSTAAWRWGSLIFSQNRTTPKPTQPTKRKAPFPPHLLSSWRKQPVFNLDQGNRGLSEVRHSQVVPSETQVAPRGQRRGEGKCPTPEAFNMIVQKKLTEISCFQRNSGKVQSISKRPKTQGREGNKEET